MLGGLVVKSTLLIPMVALFTKGFAISDVPAPVPAASSPRLANCTPPKGLTVGVAGPLVPLTWVIWGTPPAKAHA